MILYSRQYAEQGEPLLILHGLFGNQGNWAWHARELSADFAVHALDLRNHGRSDWDAQHDYALMADDVVETMSALGLESAHVLGHSMGGKVAMQLALTHPERVRSLIVVDIAPVQYPDTPYPPLAAMHAVPLASLSTRADADQAMAEYIETDAVRDFLLTNLQRDEEGKFTWRCNLDVISDNFDTIRGGLPAQGQYVGPTLFIKGKDSDYILAEHRAMIEQLFPAVSLKIISAAGHWVHSEKPRAFLRIVRSFLGK